MAMANTEDGAYAFGVRRASGEAACHDGCDGEASDKGRTVMQL
jgi:hypothetical protein